MSFNIFLFRYFPVPFFLTIKMKLGGWPFGIVIGLALIMVGWLIYRLRRRYK